MADAIIEAAARALCEEENIHRHRAIERIWVESADHYRRKAIVVLTAVTPLIEAAAKSVIEGEIAPEIMSWAESVFDAEDVRVIEAAALEKAAQVAEAQPYYPDTNIGMRQQWVKDQIAASIRALKEQP